METPLLRPPCPLAALRVLGGTPAAPHKRSDCAQASPSPASLLPAFALCGCPSALALPRPVRSSPSETRRRDPKALESSESTSGPHCQQQGQGIPRCELLQSKFFAPSHSTHQGERLLGARLPLSPPPRAGVVPPPGSTAAQARHLTPGFRFVRRVTGIAWTLPKVP